MNYFELQEAVFNHLWEKHQQDDRFTFSVRQIASKGAEKNRFIGTSRSSYFGFTCWDIPVYHPGSSSDLTNFIFSIDDDRCYLKFQYIMAKSATGIQSEADLAFGYELRQRMEAATIPLFTNADENKMLYFHVEMDQQGYINDEEVLDGFEKLYAQVAPIVDDAMNSTKAAQPEWQAARYSNERFEKLIEKMHQRIKRFANATPQELAQLSEEENGKRNGEEAADTKAFQPLNSILYGPPGTGKTYHTVAKAVAIANPDFAVEGRSRKELKDEYNRLVAEGQIQFVTFHQSMSYEDFIEGIKPMEPKEGDAFLKYRVEDGIFKRMVEQAFYVPNEQEASVYLTEEEFGKAAFYSLTLATATQPGDKAIYRYCLEHECAALNVAEGYNATGKTEAEIKAEGRSFPPGEGAALAKLVHHLKTGNYILLCDGDSTCRAIGRVTGDYDFRPNDEITPDHFRQVDWLVKDVQIPREQLYASPFAYGLERLDRSEVKKDFFTKSTVPTKPAQKRKNYVLIIDEINRGNVSQIFGELITLIEEDKRKGPGRDEALSVTLPYSKKPFSVPDNLYIIGTMNTADRSVEALDTALRRRFVFEEMAPKPELLSTSTLLTNVLNTPESFENDWEDEQWRRLADPFYSLIGAPANIEDDLMRIEQEDDDELWTEEHVTTIDFSQFNGVNLERLLTAINIRLEVLLSKDHTIGHAWLMDVYSLTDLQYAFRNKILPLLQEYFYNNYEKIGLVIGEAFFVKPTIRPSMRFAKFLGVEDVASDYAEKVIYRLKNTADLTIEDFKSIYE